MPEGDTLFKVRESIRPDLMGQRLVRVELSGRRAPSLEHAVTRVVTTGKHLLIGLDTGEMIRTHLGMSGTWHRYRHGSAWRLPAQHASLALWTERLVLVCFRAKEVECLSERAVRAHRTLSRLGPDLLAEDFESSWFDTIIDRSHHFGDHDAPVVDLLLDQRIACGVGNVFKNEALFLERVHPSRLLGTIDDAARRGLFLHARQLMLANLGGWWRTTTVDRRVQSTAPAERLWVYGRKDEACAECGSVISYARLGFGRRSTYWCETCQAEVS